MTGAGITLMDGDQVGPLCVSGQGAAALEDLQFTLGEGPCHDAYRSGRPVRVVGFDVDAPTRWLPFAELAVRTGIRAVYAYPLTCDNAKLGVLTLYNNRAEDLTGERHELCLGLADVLAATIAAMDTPTSDAPLADGIENAFAFRAEVHQASGMVAARLDSPAADALVRIRAHAFARGQPVSSVAADIVARRLRLDDDRLPHLDQEQAEQ
ncbi:MAG: hypothetical protein JWN62_996 [Acidimicrobiales bacterium]|nr:hypothetical protein [Acidimicrobiales bacterium]